jgi:hypothetical protein
MFTALTCRTDTYFYESNGRKCSLQSAWKSNFQLGRDDRGIHQLVGNNRVPGIFLLPLLPGLSVITSWNEMSTFFVSNNLLCLFQVFGNI